MAPPMVFTYHAHTELLIINITILFSILMCVDVSALAHVCMYCSVCCILITIIIHTIIKAVDVETKVFA